MSRDISMLKYLPMFVREYREIQEIMKVSEEEVIDIYKEIEAIYKNQFIKTCDEIGIKKYEDLVGIIASKNDSLENRKAKVLTRWIYDIPYTYEVLQSLLNNLCGEDGYFMYLFENKYSLDIHIRLISKDMYNEVSLLIKRVVPCNISVNIVIDYNKHINFIAFMHKELETFTHKELREKIIEVNNYLYKNSEYKELIYSQLNNRTNHNLRRKGEWFNGEN